MTGFNVESFTPMAKNTLVGFATIRVPSGLVFHDVGVHRQGDSLWAMPASKPMLGPDGVQLRDTRGKLRWTPIVSFADKRTRDRWSDGVIAALREPKPEVLS
jgi:hypothetical protein